MIIIARAISGCQTGTDVGSLRAAKSRSVPTGGTMPKGFRTLIGPKPEWAREFGLIEHTSSAYPPRTFANVRAADVTVRIAYDFESAGERLTLKAIRALGKPEPFDIRLENVGLRRYEPNENDIADAINGLRALSLRLGRPIVVNFAGNSERTAPGIEVAAKEIVGRILDGCRS